MPDLLRTIAPYISLLILFFGNSFSSAARSSSFIFFYGDTIRVWTDSTVCVDYNKPNSEEAVRRFYQKIEQSGIDNIVEAILAYRKAHDLDDWIYYHLIRATAEKLSPKAENYERYTLYKWYVLIRSGYSSLLTITSDKMLFYVQSNDEVFEIPTRMHKGFQYVCLNYHDYGEIDFTSERFNEAAIQVPHPDRSFTYIIKKLPDFSSQRYVTREFDFDYYQRDYTFRVMVNPDVQKIFANYPVLNYSYYFNIPMSNITYSSLIPLLKQQLHKMEVKKGVDYLMRFARYAFNYETDTKQFGKEKRLSAEQTLLYSQSDCEDRAAFFFYLVKEIYNLPMIVLTYPKHVTVAVNFGRKLGKDAIKYKGGYYAVCEPSSQKIDLKIGEMLSEWRKMPYQIVYEYKTVAD